jgi:hypothetical protein
LFPLSDDTFHVGFMTDETLLDDRTNAKPVITSDLEPMHRLRLYDM